MHHHSIFERKLRENDTCGRTAHSCIPREEWGYAIEDKGDEVI